jgi:WD40 repeat protein
MFLLPTVLPAVEESAETRITTVDAITGWSDTESQAAPLAERPLPANPDDLVSVFGEYWQWSNAKRDRWMFGDGTAAIITKTGELGFLGQGGDKPVRRITVAAPTTPQLAVSPDGRVIAATDGEAAMIWADRPRAARLAFSEIRHLATSRSGRTALTTGDRIMAVDAAGKRLATTKFRDLTRLASCAAHDLIAAVNGRNIVVFDEDLGLRATLSLPAGPAPARKTKGGTTAPAPKFTTVSWNRTGRKLVAGTNQGRVLVFDERTGEPTLDIHVPGAVREAVVLPAHNALLVWTEPGRLLLVDDTTGQIRKRRNMPGITGVAVHPAFGWVATGHDDGQVTLCDVGASDIQVVVGHHFGPVTALAFSDDRLVVGAGRTGHRGSITTYQWTAPVGEAR